MFLYIHILSFTLVPVSSFHSIMLKASKKPILFVAEKLSTWNAVFPWIGTQGLPFLSAEQRRYYCVVCAKAESEFRHFNPEKTWKSQQIRESEDKHVSAVSSSLPGTRTPLSGNS